MRKKIAIVVQRYGNEVNGGAELHARQLAEQLNKQYNLEVLTTTALDYDPWENYYEERTEIINQVRVRRFSNIQSTNKQLRKARRGIFSRKKYFKFLKYIGLFDFVDQLLDISTPTEKDVDYWLKRQGPYCPKMIEYIVKHKDDFDAFIFFTYLYYPTAVGMPLVRDKSIFIPTAHDEKIMFTKAYENIFSQAAYIMFNSYSEKKLVEDNFKDVAQQNAVAGVGIPLTPEVPNVTNILKDFSVEGPYFIYIGRIDKSKGCDELIAYFERYAVEEPSVKLVLVGKNYMDVVGRDNLLLTGFIDDDLKNALLKNSEGLIIPSKHESLSMVALEALAAGKSIIVNGDCEVLRDHVSHSGTGKYYHNYEDFRNQLNQTIGLTAQEKTVISEKAIKYVKENYCWDTIIKKFDVAIQYIHDQSAV